MTLPDEPIDWTGTPTPPATPSRRRRWPIVAVCAVAVLALTGLSIGVALRSTGDQTALPAASPSPGCQTYGPTGCEDGKTYSPAAPNTSPPPPVELTVAGWVLGGGGTHMSAITADFGTIGRSHGNAELRDGCALIQRDVRDAQAYPAIPDGQAQQDWSAALTSFAHGATDCIAGVDGRSSSAIRRSTSEFGTGQDHLDKVIARLTALAPR